MCHWNGTSIASKKADLDHMREADVAPLRPGFALLYPNVRVGLVAANWYYDVIDNHIDVAIRAHEFEPDS